MEERKYKRLKISGIILLVAGVIIILLGIIVLVIPIPMDGWIGSTVDQLRRFEILFFCVIGGCPIICIGGGLWGYSASIKKRPVRKAREVKLKKSGVYTKMLESQKKSGIALTVIGSVLILMGTIILYTMHIVWMLLFIFLGVFLFFVGVGLWIHSVNKEKLRELEES